MFMNMQLILIQKIESGIRNQSIAQVVINPKKLIKSFSKILESKR